MTSDKFFCKNANSPNCRSLYDLGTHGECRLLPVVNLVAYPETHWCTLGRQEMERADRLRKAKESFEAELVEATDNA